MESRGLARTPPFARRVGST